MNDKKRNNSILLHNANYYTKIADKANLDDSKYEQFCKWVYSEIYKGAVNGQYFITLNMSEFPITFCERIDKTLHNNGFATHIIESNPENEMAYGLGGYISRGHSYYCSMQISWNLQKYNEMINRTLKEKMDLFQANNIL